MPTHYNFSSSPQIPIEIWNQVFHYLSYSQQLAVSHVCKKFHDIATVYLFRSIRIHFINEASIDLLKGWVSAEKGGNKDASARLLYERLVGRSWSLLNRLQQDRTTAPVVREIVVICLGSCSIFESMSLEFVIRKLPNLTAFYWFGDSMPENVAAALPSSLKILSTQAQHSVASIGPLNNLQILRFVQGAQDGTPELASNVATIINNQASTLRSIAIDPPILKTLSILRLSCLIELEIFSVEDDCEGLNLVLRHLNNLRSFALSNENNPDVIFELPLDNRLLPNLDSFRLRVYNAIATKEQFEHLDQFLLLKGPALRRLHLAISGYNPSEDWIAYSPVRMPNLEALLLDLEYGQHRVLRPMLIGAIPLGLHALRLSFEWDDIVSLFPLIAPAVVERISQMPNLSFLMIDELNGFDVPFEKRDLAECNKELEIIGLNKRYWEVDRSGLETEFIRKKRWQSELLVASDFNDPNHEWVYRYH